MSPNDSTQVEREIEISIDAAQEVVNKKDKMLSLIEDKRFKELFEDGYFRDEAARLVALLSDDEFADQERRQLLINDMIGISSTRKFIVNTLKMGRDMEQRIKYAEQELETLRDDQTGE